MTHIFSPVVDIETRKMQWAMYKDFQFVGIKNSVEIAAHFSDKYSVEMEDWRQAHK